MKQGTDLRSTSRYVDATPYAASLIEGHRDLGYSLETAVADVIDNSITAGASMVRITAETAADEPWIALADDGCGMSETELVDAMRLGSKNPTEERAAKDLGRFGLGLKSASFSQCRCLTVLTRQEGVTSCARWDLDRVAERNDWDLQLIDNIEAVNGSHLLPQCGTVVIWENLDRLNGGYADNGKKRTEHMNSELTRAERHLRLVFHRFLEGANPRLTLLLNERPLEYIDPMASTHSATQRTSEDTLKLPRGRVRIKSYTLPHHTKMSRHDWNEVGGPEGHLKTQGLYVYRENRLIIAGGWLGLARQTELTKLCRISVDIPNTMDSEWKIDVKKASAQLPPLVRERLKTLIEGLSGTSIRTYGKRGQKLVDENHYPIWNRIKKDALIVFQPNLEHPVFRAYAEQLPIGLREGFERCLRIVGSGLPIETLHVELVGHAESVKADTAEESDIKEVVESLAAAFIESGLKEDNLPDVMKSNPFLLSHWDMVEIILREFIERRHHE